MTYENIPSPTDLINAAPVVTLIISTTILGVIIGQLVSMVWYRRWAVKSIGAGVELFVKPIVAKIELAQKICEDLARLTPCPHCGFLTTAGGMSDTLKFICPDCGETSRWVKLTTNIKAKQATETEQAQPPRVLERYMLEPIEGTK